MTNEGRSAWWLKITAKTSSEASAVRRNEASPQRSRRSNNGVNSTSVASSCTGQFGQVR